MRGGRRGGTSSAPRRRPSCRWCCWKTSAPRSACSLRCSASPWRRSPATPRWDAVGSIAIGAAAGGHRDHPRGGDEGPADRRVGQSDEDLDAINARRSAQRQVNGIIHLRTDAPRPRRAAGRGQARLRPLAHVRRLAGGHRRRRGQPARRGAASLPPSTSSPTSGGRTPSEPASRCRRRRSLRAAQGRALGLHRARGRHPVVQRRLDAGEAGRDARRHGGLLADAAVRVIWVGILRVTEHRWLAWADIRPSLICPASRSGSTSRSSSPASPRPRSRPPSSPAR